MLTHSRYTYADDKYISHKFKYEEFDLTHIRRLTNEVGILQHAKYGTRDYTHGYCLDDNCRALMLAGIANNIFPESNNHLIDTYLAFVLYMQRENGQFGNFLSFDHRFLDENGTEDAFGRTIWSLGSLMRKDSREYVQLLLKEIIDKAYPHFTSFSSLRAAAYTLCGLVHIHQSNRYHKDLIPEIYLLADFICNEYEKASDDDWKWYESIITYDNAIIPYSLMLTKDILYEERYVLYSIESAEFLDDILFQNDKLELVGNAGWFPKSGMKTSIGEQAIEIPSLILMYQKLAEITNAPRYHHKAKDVFAWFHGNNRLGIELFDHETKGCRDGLDERTVNQNQGAESSISYWLAYIFLQHEEI